jgi:very-short-patch-repair endonuclease
VSAFFADGVVLYARSQMYNANQMSYSRSPSDFNNLPLLKTFRTKLRKGLTPAEAAFWRIVKNSRLDGKKFRRQHSIGRYILDFYCPSERLGIELDGDGHFSEQKQWYDSERKIFIKQFGILVIRFENKWVFEEPEWVLQRVRSCFGWREERTTPSAEADMSISRGD